MANLSDLLGGLIHNSQSTGNTDDNFSRPSQSLSDLLGQVSPPQQVSVDPTLAGDAGQRPFTHTQIVQKHGLSNILSILGDAFLASHGLQPQYLPKVQAAQDADAMEGYDKDPLGAIKQLSVIDPKRADDMRNDFYQNLYRQQLALTSAAAAQKDQAQLPGIQAESQDKVLLPIAGLVGKANKDTYPGIRSTADRILRANGLGYRADLLPATFTPEGVAGWSQGALTPDKQAQIDYRNRRGNQFDEQLGLNRENVDSEVGYRGTMAGVAQENAGTHAKDVNDEISYRAWQKVHGDKTATTAADDAAGKAEYRKWLMAHPSKQRLGNGPPPVGYKNANGLTFSGGDPNDRKNWK